MYDKQDTLATNRNHEGVAFLRPRRVIELLSIVLEQEIQRNELKYQSNLPLNSEPNLKKQEKKKQNETKCKKRNNETNS